MQEGIAKYSIRWRYKKSVYFFGTRSDESHYQYNHYWIDITRTLTHTQLDQHLSGTANKSGCNSSTTAPTLCAKQCEGLMTPGHAHACVVPIPTLLSRQQYTAPPMQNIHAAIACMVDSTTGVGGLL